MRILLVDDHAVLRQGLRMLIETQSDMVVVGEAESGREAMTLLGDGLEPDVIVLDVSLPEQSGPRVAAQMMELRPTTRILALTRHGEKAYVQQMMQAGARGYVLKQTAAEVLIAAIRSVAAGGSYLDPVIAAKLLDEYNSRPSRAGASLTKREQEIVTMVAYGHTNKEISNTLGITVKTVETHKTNIMQKLEITSRAELVRYALSQGWIER